MKIVLTKQRLNYTFDAIRVDFAQSNNVRIECSKYQFSMNVYEVFNDCEFVTQSDTDIIICPYEYLHCVYYLIPFGEQHPSNCKKSQTN